MWRCLRPNPNDTLNATILFMSGCAMAVSPELPLYHEIPLSMPAVDEYFTGYYRHIRIAPDCVPDPFLGSYGP
jgi:hypothetical protein